MHVVNHLHHRESPIVVKRPGALCVAAFGEQSGNMPEISGLITGVVHFRTCVVCSDYTKHPGHQIIK
eukprot:6382202-Pyramimonas_sp.AAC.1